MNKSEYYKDFTSTIETAFSNFYIITSANEGHLALQLSYTSFRLADAKGELCDHVGPEPLFKIMRQIEPKTVEALSVVYFRSAFITIVTLFDTFLSDITRFLLLLHPDAISKERPIRFGEILSHDSIPEIIDSVVGKVVHEVSYKNFPDRINYLKSAFGIDISHIADKIKNWLQN